LLLKGKWLLLFNLCFVAGCHISSSALSHWHAAEDENTSLCAAEQWTATSSDSILYRHQASGRNQSHAETLLQSKQ